MFHLVGEAAQRTISEPCGLAAKFRYVVAHRVGAAAQCFRNAAQSRGDHIADMVDSLRGARGGAAANCFQAPLQRRRRCSTSPISAERAREYPDRENMAVAAAPATALAPLMGAVEPGVDLAVGLVLGHAVTLLQAAGEF